MLLLHIPNWVAVTMFTTVGAAIVLAFAISASVAVCIKFIEKIAYKIIHLYTQTSHGNDYEPLFYPPSKLSWTMECWD